MANPAVPLKDPSLSRVPPQSIEAEESLLSSLLLDEQAILSVQELLSAEDFYVDAHRKIYEAMLELFGKGEPTDVVTVGNLLKRKKALEESGGLPYLGRLVNEVPMAVNAPFYATIIHEKAVLRRLITRASDIVTRCFEESGSVADLVDFAENAIFSVSDEKKRSSIHPLKGLLTESLRAVSKRSANKAHVTGVPTGLPKLNLKTSGLQPSDLIILAARPGMGKTSLALNIAVNAAREKVPVLVFSLEMSKEQLVTRVLCGEAKVNSQRVRDGFLRPEEMAALVEASGRITDLPIFIDDSPILTALDVRATARRLSREKQVGLIVIDYLQLMKGPPSKERRELEISEISRSLKALAKELSVPVLALSQLNRQVETPGGSREPQLSHLRESGALEQDADMILFLFQSEAPSEDTDKVMVELKIAKHRNGPTGKIPLWFFKEYTSFAERTDNY
ncbi:MAG: replicative DNA helicase [Thermodesulfobacteriota bacterium]